MLKKIAKWSFVALSALFIAAVILLNLVFPFRYDTYISKEAGRYGIDKNLVRAVIWTESKFRSDAVSHKGAAGLMQLMPSTAEWCASETDEEYSYERLFEPEYNIKLGVFYLARLIKLYGEDGAIAAYNAGEGNYTSWQGEIRFQETRTYIKRVNFSRGIYSFKSQ